MIRRRDGIDRGARANFETLIRAFRDQEEEDEEYSKLGVFRTEYIFLPTVCEFRPERSSYRRIINKLPFERPMEITRIHINNDHPRL